MGGRRSIATMAILAVLATGCGSSAPSSGDAGATASGGPASGAATSAASAASAAPSDDAADGVPQVLLATVGDGDLNEATLAERDARAWLDEQTGLAAAIGPTLETWLQETRSDARHRGPRGERRSISRRSRPCPSRPRRSPRSTCR